MRRRCGISQPSLHWKGLFFSYSSELIISGRAPGRGPEGTGNCSSCCAPIPTVSTEVDRQGMDRRVQMSDKDLISKTSSLRSLLLQRNLRRKSTRIQWKLEPLKLWDQINYIMVNWTPHSDGSSQTMINFSCLRGRLRLLSGN